MIQEGTDLEGTPIVLMDANRLFREGLKRILVEHGAAVVADADEIGAGRLKLLGRPAPRLVIADPGDHRDGGERIRDLVSEFGVPVLVLTETFRMSALTGMLQVGAAGYLLKSVSSEALLHSVRLLLLGEKVFPSSLARHLVPSQRYRPVLGDGRLGRSFTRQELAVLSALREGKNNRQIASTLGISAATVRIYMKRLLRKLNVSNRTQAALWALSNDVAGGAGVSESEVS